MINQIKPLLITTVMSSLLLASPLAIAKKGKSTHKHSAPAQQIAAPGTKTVKIDLSKLTWAAYTPSGELLKWGRVSGGKNYCPDIKRACRTPVGTYTVYMKRGAGCKSTKFPVGKGGAKMPYCMFFKGGYAMHGSNSVPNYNASHGCVRMPPADAQWLNTQFVDVGSTKVKVTR